MKTYLITGGAGFIGNHFAEHLLKRNDQVVILDNLSRNGSKSNLDYLKNKYPDLRFVKADIVSDLKIIEKIISEVDVVYHFAGQVAVTTSIKNPRSDFEINAIGTFNILEAIRQSENKPLLIYASTNKVYGGMEEVKILEKKDRFEYRDFPEGIPEKHLLDFHSPYGCSKGAADQYVRDYSRIYNLQTVVMRQSCIYGTRQFGIEDQGWLAWFLIASLLSRPITIYGNGKQVRDILYISDLFEAWDLASSNINITNGKIYNVGGGNSNSISLLQTINILEKKLNKKINYKFSDWRSGDQPIYVSDIRKIKKDLGWKPQISVENGIDAMIDWSTKNIKLLENILRF